MSTHKICSHEKNKKTISTFTVEKRVSSGAVDITLCKISRAVLISATEALLKKSIV